MLVDDCLWLNIMAAGEMPNFQFGAYVIVQSHCLSAEVKWRIRSTRTKGLRINLAFIGEAYILS